MFSDSFCDCDHFKLFTGAPCTACHGGVPALINAFDSVPLRTLTFRSFAVQLSMLSMTGRLVVILAHTYTTGRGFTHCYSDIHRLRWRRLFTDLLCSLFGAQVRLVLVGWWGLRAAGWLVQELPQTLGKIPHWAIVVPKRWIVDWWHRLRTPYRASSNL